MWKAIRRRVSGLYAFDLDCPKNAAFVLPGCASLSTVGTPKLHLYGAVSSIMFSGTVSTRFCIVIERHNVTVRLTLEA
jgi:hypothetical protein